MGGIATAAGLFFAGYEIRAAKRERSREEERRREDQRLEREAMARAVSITTAIAEPTEEEIAARYEWADREVLPEHSVWYRLDYRVHNGGSLPIDDVVLSAGDIPITPEQADELASPASEDVIGTVAAGATVTGNKVAFFYGEPAFAELPYLASLRFTDAWEVIGYGGLVYLNSSQSLHASANRPPSRWLGRAGASELQGRQRRSATDASRTASMALTSAQRAVLSNEAHPQTQAPCKAERTASA